MDGEYKKRESGEIKSKSGINKNLRKRDRGSSIFVLLFPTAEGSR